MRYIVSSHYITIYQPISEVSLENNFLMCYNAYKHTWGGIGMETWEAVAHRIRGLCREQGITPNKLSKISGVPQATVKSLLLGESKNPGTVAVKRLCDGFGITLGEFFDSPEFDALFSPRPRGEHS